MRKRWMRLVLGLGGFALLVGLVGRGLVLKVEGKAGQEAEQIASLAAEGQRRFLWTMAELTLEHLAGRPEVQALEETACEHFVSYWKHEAFAVLALGDSEGEAVCVADPKVSKPYPTMSDRLYFERVRQAEGVVAGEYAVSRTTGKEVLHFAYPVRVEGEFEGLVMAGLELSWLGDEVLDRAFSKGGGEMMILDEDSRVLAAYPEEVKEVGESGLNVKLLNFYLSGERGFKTIKGVDGKRRVYAYRKLGEEEGAVLFVGVKTAKYYRSLAGVILLVGLVMGAGGGLVWFLRKSKEG